MAQEITDIEALYARLEAAERALAQIRVHHAVMLNTLDKTYSNLTTALDTLSRFKVEYEAVQADLNAARTASELAARHREALEGLVQAYQQGVQIGGGTLAWREQHRLQRRADELLAGDALTPLRTEQLASLIKAYEYFVVEHCTTKDDKAKEARAMLIKQYTRVIGEATA